jgi:Lrp/AsnC family transcriptional regulator for asnA, asnC and gidA
MTLDSQDQALLAALQAEPRARAIQLGARVGMSAPTVSARLRRLIDGGIVEVVGILNAQALDRSHTVVALMRGLRSNFLEAWRGKPGLIFAAQALGAWDGLACMIGQDAAAVEPAIDELRHMADVVEVHTVLSISVTGVTMSDPVTIRDASDRDIACLLSRDARMSFTQIAQALEIPESTARTRAQRLLDGHVVTPIVLPNPVVFGLVGGALGIEASGPAAELHDALSPIPGVITVLRLQGRFAAAVETIAPHASALVAIRDAISRLDCVKSVEVMTYGERIIGRWPLPAFN